jgi:hypothetical protein
MQGFAKDRYQALFARLAGTSSAETNLTAASRIGTTITAGAANTKGSYTTLLTTGHAATSLWLRASAIASAGAIRDALMDISYDSGVTVHIPNINISEADTIGTGTLAQFGKFFFFPGLAIPASAVIQARFQSNNAGQTAIISAWTDASIFWANSALTPWVDYGSDTANSRGTSVTPGSGAFGAWTQIGGATSREHNLWVFGIDGLGNATIAAAAGIIDIGTGPDAGTVTTMLNGGSFSFGSSETCSSSLPAVFSYNLTAGSLLWARAASGNTTAIGVNLLAN